MAEFVVDRDGVYRRPPLGCDRLGCGIDWQHTHADLLSVRFTVGA